VAGSSRRLRHCLPPVFKSLDCTVCCTVQFTGGIEEAKQMMMFHLDDAFRAARGLYMTQKEVDICVLLLITVTMLTAFVRCNVLYEIVLPSYILYSLFYAMMLIFSKVVTVRIIVKYSVL